MRRGIFAGVLIGWLIPIVALAQQGKLVGRWEGTLESPQGERPTTATFKKAGDGYTGVIAGMRGDMTLKDIKFDGEKVTAQAVVDTPQGPLTIDYSFILKDDTLKGTGSLSFSGTPFSFDINLKRAPETAAAPGAGPAAPGATQATRPPRRSVQQPQQKQSIDYFVGKWSYRYLGRESALGPAPREGVATFSKRADGVTVDGVLEGKHDGGAYKDTMTIVFDESTKALTFQEKLAAGPTVQSKGDWSSPISIRFTIDPIKIKGQTLQLRRTISVISGHSFTVAEDLSEDGGPFVRLGSAVFSKMDEK
jgi:hypothetical protein